MSFGQPFNMVDSSSLFQVMDPSAEASSSRATAHPESEPLEQRCARLAMERDMLLRKIEVRKLEEEVCILRRQVEDESVADAESVEDLSPDDASTSSKRRRQEGDIGGDTLSSKRSSVGGDIQTVKPDPYDRKSLYNFKEYVRRCEITFHLGPDQYSKDSTRVLYTAQFLVGETARAFKHLEEMNGLDTTSCENYKTFL